MKNSFWRGLNLDFSIIPDGVIRRLTEAKIRQKGEVWMIHKNDLDPFPSNPHAHNYESGHTLHLGTGHLFLQRKYVGKIRRKDLRLLRTKILKANISLLGLEMAP